MEFRLLEKYNTLAPLNRFIFKGACLYLLWLAFRKYTYVYGMEGCFTHAYSNLYLWVSDLILRLIGLNPDSNFTSNQMCLPGGAGIVVQYGCLGIGIMFHFLIFIVAYPGTLKTKAWYIPLGLLAIFFTNAVRIASLAWINCFVPEYFNLSHHFIFPAIIYIVVFLLCLYWAKNLENI